MDAISISFRQDLEKGYLGKEPLATQTAANQQNSLDTVVTFFNYYDQNRDGQIDESEFIKFNLTDKAFCQNEQEAKNLFNAISENDGKISAERYGAFCNVRSSGGGHKCFPYMDGTINDFLTDVAKNGHNTLFKDGLTLGQKIDLVQYNEIKYATTEQIDKGILQLVKKSEME